MMRMIQVNCYSGHTYAERPQSFLWQDTEYKVVEIEKAWQEPGKKLFKVLTEQGKSFELCYNETEDQWSATELGSLGGDMEQIFQILEQNARATPEQISTMLGMPVSEVEKTIKQAEENKTIIKYKTIINWAKLGQEEVWALIEVKVTPQRDVGFDTIAEHIYRFPQVYSAYLVSGTYDLAILVKGKNMQEISSFVTEKLAPLEKVQSTVTHFLLKRYKDDGEIIELAEEAKRLPITL